MSHPRVSAAPPPKVHWLQPIVTSALTPRRLELKCSLCPDSALCSLLIHCSMSPGSQARAEATLWVTQLRGLTGLSDTEWHLEAVIIPEAGSGCHRDWNVPDPSWWHGEGLVTGTLALAPAAVMSTAAGWWLVSRGAGSCPPIRGRPGDQRPIRDKETQCDTPGQWLGPGGRINILQSRGWPGPSPRQPHIISGHQWRLSTQWHSARWMSYYQYFILVVSINAPELSLCNNIVIYVSLRHFLGQRLFETRRRRVARDQHK